MPTNSIEIRISGLYDDSTVLDYLRTTFTAAGIEVETDPLRDQSGILVIRVNEDSLALLRSLT